MLYRMPPSARFFVVASLAAVPLQAAPEWPDVQPVLAESCYDCHSAAKTKGGVDLKSLADNPAVEGNYALWEKVREVVAKGEMPPEDETALSAAEKQSVLGWVTHSLDAVAAANAGDPGPVTLRRLTNAEFDYTIRDLTGRDYGLAKEFMPDGGGGEGFSNTGDVLFVNPAQLDKYLAAARKLADHVTVMPGTGLRFHEQRVGLRGPAQVRGQADQALYVWYQKAAGPHLPTDSDDLREADYLLACWKWKHRALTGAASLDELARQAKLSTAFLENWWRVLNNEKTASRYLDLTRVPWRNLPAPEAAKPKEVPSAVLAGVQAIQKQRRSWYEVAKAGNSSVQRRQQDADGLRSYRLSLPIQGQRQVHVVIGAAGDGGAGDYVQISGLSFRLKGKNHEYVPWTLSQRDADKKALKEIEAGKPAPQGLDAAALKKRIAGAEAALAFFGKNPLGKAIPATTLAAKAPRVITLPLPEGATEVFGSGKLDLQSPEANESSVQWTLRTGAAPDAAQILPGVLTVWKRQTPKANATMSDFGRMKTAFPDIYDRRMEEVARNHTRGNSELGVYYFSDSQLGELISPKEYLLLKDMQTDWSFAGPDRLPPKLAAEWDARVIQHLQTFASLAWRRPTSDEEKKQFEDLFRAGLSQDLDRESAAREVLVRVLVSPNFLYKTEVGAMAAAATEAAPKEVALNAWELASRLSYFLWSSKPDAALRAAAADGSLLKPEVLAAQTQRMMQDAKAEALAKEFAGQWLEFAGFATHNAVDAKKFPEFTPELRRDLTRETTHFFTHLIRQNRPVREIVGADYTFLNERLAKHYGVPGVTGEDFRQVSVAAQHRGGLLGQGSVLTKTSRSHRTSPVLRGNWLLQAVLGTPVPPPPADVPELKEHGPKPATVREMLEKHRAAKACSSCHDRIDPLGFALENFDAIGRYRDKDEAGLPLDTSGQVKGGAKFSGIEGLRSYLATQEAQFTNHFCRKLLGYALGRQVLPTDKALITTMKADLKKDEGHFSAPILAVVQSRQFRNKRL